MKIILTTLLIAVTSGMLRGQPSAELRLVRDSFTEDVFLMAVIHSNKADLRIKGIKLYDPAANVDVTRVSDGKEFSNYAGGFFHGPYMRDFVIPAGVNDVHVRIPFPRSEILMADKPVPGEYLFKLRYFSGEPLAVRILEDGSLIPSKRQTSKRLQNADKAEQDGTDQPATAPESKSEGEQKPKTESKVRPQ